MGGSIVTRDQNLFQQTFQDSPIGMAILDEIGCYIELNPALATILGLTVEELQGRNFADFTHPDDLERDVALLSKVAAGTLPYYQVQKRYVHTSGDVVWSRVTVSDVGGRKAHRDRRFVVQVEDITEIRRTKDLLEHRALYDHLTGLANRTLLLDRLTHALRNHRTRVPTVACIFIDVDHFKVVNDSLGHEAGDVLLKALAERIQGAVRAGDTVARLGGDEFVVVLEHILEQADAETSLRVITAAVQEPIVIEGHELAPTVSAGLAIADSSTSAESLVRNADTAMYAAKERGRARVEVFSSDMRQHALHKLSVEAELRTAIRDGELVVYYQPVVDLATRNVVAFEALVRWRHPQRGLLLPQDFIAICEEANLIVPMGAFVLHEACQFIAERPQFEGRVFVNVSTQQIGTADLTKVVSLELEASGIGADRLALEITETGMLMASQEALNDLSNLTALGVDLILDDFGTGYSALSSILQNPVSGIKLARDFTLRLGDKGTGDRISTAMATLAISLDVYGVVEGVETEAQYAQALRHGWKLGQGFLFGHGVPAEAITVYGDGDIEINNPEAPSRPTAAHRRRSPVLHEYW
jgi:diguanylate cyclase (GGDEF)-like protein/PAS domain S-box-containing protein